MTASLLEPLDALQKLTHTLFLSLSPPQTKPPPPPAIEAFIEADIKLAEELHKARTHQQNQRRIDALFAEVLDLEMQLREVRAELEKGKRELEVIIEEGDSRVESIRKAKEGVFLVAFDYTCAYDNYLQRPYHTLSCLHTRKVSVPSHPLHLICQI